MDKMLIYNKLQMKYQGRNFSSLEEKRLNAEEKNMTQTPCVICWSRVKQKLTAVYVSCYMTASNIKPTNRFFGRMLRILAHLKNNVRPFNHNGLNHVAFLQKRKKEKKWRDLKTSENILNPDFQNNCLYLTLILVLCS